MSLDELSKARLQWLFDCRRRNCPYRDDPDAIFAMIHCELQPGKRKPPVQVVATSIDYGKKQKG
jgi:hypothetical protein